MQIRLHEILGLLFLLPLVVQAQIVPGKITIEDLQEQKHQVEPEAEAAFLFSVGETSFVYDVENGFKMITKVTNRIKIYSKEGYSWGNKEISYYTGKGEVEKIRILEANTYNLTNGKIEKTAAKVEGIFDVKENDSWSIKKIILPNVKEGSILEYVYTIESPYLSTIPEFQFQYSIPVNKAQFSVLVPEYFVYVSGYKGFRSPTIVRKDELALLSYGSNRLRDKKYNMTRTTYSLNRVESVRKEQFVNNMDNYTASVVHDLTLIRYPDSPVKSISLTINDLVKNIYKNKSFGAELEAKNYFEKDLAPILSGVHTEEEKAQLILKFIKNNVSWNNKYGYYCDKGVKSAYREKSGNVADLNLMLTAMLRSAGLEANPVLISTRENGIKPGVQRSSFNYVVAALEIDGGVYLLDATSMYSNLSILPIRTINWFGALIKKDGSMTEVQVYPNFQSLDSKIINLQLSSDWVGIGQIREEYNRYNAYLFRENYGEQSKEKMINDVESKNAGLEIVGLRVDHLDDLSKSVKIVSNFKQSNMVDVIGGKIYLNPLFFSSLKESPFKAEKREYAIDFVFPELQKYQLSFKIPEGYRVDYLPKNEKYSLDEIGLEFSYEITQQEQTINFVFLCEKHQAVIEAKDYLLVKKFFDKMVAKHKDKIVLNKI